MVCTPLAIIACRKREEDVDNASHGSNEGDCTTQDGTIDVYGRPASRRRTGGWKGAVFCLAQQMMATLALNGIAANLVTYMTVVMHQSNQTAAQNVSNWNGTTYITPFIFAFIADSYAGRFPGAVIASAIDIMGFVMLTIAGTLHALRPPQCPSKDLSCEKPTLSQSVFLFGGLYVAAIGYGGLSVTLTTIGADQFDEEDAVEAKKKSSYFTANLMSFLVGSFVALTLFVYVHDDVSAGLAWGLSTVVLVVGTVVFVFGRPIFRYHRTAGNALTRIVQVIVAFVRKINLKVVNPDDLYDVQDSESGIKRIKHSGRFRFLDKAALLTDKDKRNEGQVRNPWRVCTVTQVEEVKFLFSVFPIFMTCIVFSTCWSQALTLFIEQGHSMNCKLGSFTIPPASIATFESLGVFSCALVYDRLLVPFLRRRTGHPRGMTDLKRIGFGLFFSICAMVIAAVVDSRRIHTARVHGLLDSPDTPIPMSVFYLIPQYFVMGAAEVFTYVGLVEFFHDMAPDALRCLATSLELLTIALGFFVGTLLLIVVRNITKRGGKPGWIADNLNRGRLDLFYWLLVVLSTISLLLFILFAVMYKYKVVAKGLAQPRTMEESKAASTRVSLQLENLGEVSASTATSMVHPSLDLEPLRRRFDNSYFKTSSYHFSCQIIAEVLLHSVPPQFGASINSVTGSQLRDPLLNSVTSFSTQ